MEKTILITGASSGIGKACAELLAEKGFRLIVCGRRADRLTEIVNQLKSKTEIIPLIFDVRSHQEVNKAIQSLPPQFSKIDVLINNAGNAHGLSSFENGSVEDWDAMIDINVKGLLYVSKAVAGGMVERKSGHIINIGSVAGKEVYPNGNVYCASKHAVDAISKSMRIDLNQYGIKVGEVNPGMVKTEFSLVRFKGDKERADKVYEGFEPLLPQDISEIIWFMISRPAHVNIADVIVYPTAQAAPGILNKN